MTNLYSFVLISLILLLLLSSCEDPEYPVVPFIELQEASFTPYGMKVSIAYRDGDSDLGLSSKDDQPPFHSFDIPKDINGNYIFFDYTQDIFDCRHFSYFFSIGSDTIRDTIKYIPNKFYYNFKVDVLVKRGGKFVEYDFRKELCRAPLGGRFTYINPSKKAYSLEEGPFKLYQKNPQQGRITYEIDAPGFGWLFGQKTVKLRVQIYDRALNESNIVESEPIFVE